MQVYLLKPGGSAQWHFAKLANLLEQFVSYYSIIIIFCLTISFILKSSFYFY